MNRVHSSSRTGFRNRKDRSRSRLGAAVVEAAVTLPVLIIVILGTVEVCNHIFLRQSLKMMAFEGARVAVIPEATLTDVEMQVEETAQEQGVTVKSVQIEPVDFQSQPAGTFLEVQVTSDSNQPGRSSLFPSSETTVSVFIMKEYD